MIVEIEFFQGPRDGDLLWAEIGEDWEPRSYTEEDGHYEWQGMGYCYPVSDVRVSRLEYLFIPDTKVSP